MEMAFLYSIPHTSSSFPSTHSAWAFGAATAVFLHNKKAGIITIIVASVIAFSRLYMFMHFPTDVLAGIVLGVVIGILVVSVQSIVANHSRHN